MTAAETVADEIADIVGDVGKAGSGLLNAPIVGPLLGSIPIVGEVKSWLQIFFNIAAAAPSLVKDVEGGETLVTGMARAGLDALAAKSETPEQQAYLSAAADCVARGLPLDSPAALALHPELASDRQAVFG